MSIITDSASVSDSAYIVLDGYRYKVSATAHEPGEDSPGQMRYTISGKLDRAESGIVQWEWRYTLIIPWQASGAFGGLAQLRTSFEKKSPPNNQLSLTDPYGNTYTVYFVEKGRERNLMSVLTSTLSKYLVDVTLVKVI